MPKGFTGVIVFREPTSEAKAAGTESIDGLLALADQALHSSVDYMAWILLDRLDVAFVENPELANLQICLWMWGFSNDVVP